MLQAATPAPFFKTERTSSGLTRSPIRSKGNSGIMADDDFHSDDEDLGGKHRNKSRRELPAGAVATLKSWLLSPEHFTHPYPTPQDQVMLMQKTGIDKKQLKNWFTNARRRIWKPMLKKQLEQGKLAATGTGGGVALPGVVPGMMVTGMPGQTEQVQYQQATGQEIQVDQFGNPVYQQQAVAATAAPPPQFYDPSTGAPASLGAIAPMPQPGSLSAGLSSILSSQPMSKTDSHAVLMELFARDQDLVRQATETAAKKSSGQDPQPTSSGAPFSSQSQLSSLQQNQAQTQQGMSSQHPMKTPSHGRLVSVPTLNSWPHFSSVSSLNNLGTMPGVKSITSLSAADLVKQGAVNSVGNLAQVKSVESMGKNDSYAFLEVFFGDRSSNALSSMGGNGSGNKDQRGIKRERDEDNDVGLSLEDESPSAAAGQTMKQDSEAAPAPTSDLSSMPFSAGKSALDSTDTLKRAYDDAMAARGLISVSRSSEKLTDLALPAKMQRTLSQDLMRQQQDQSQPVPSFLQYQYTPSPGQTSANQNSGEGGHSHQYPAQPTAQSDQSKFANHTGRDAASGASVEVPSATKCAICHQINVDTQLRPCGHMFHEKCLKPSLQASMGAPKCPVDHTPMQSALLAIPTDENAKPPSGSVAPQNQVNVWAAGTQGHTVASTKQ